MATTGSKPVLFTGHEDFRTRIVLATLAGRAIKISGIRSDDLEPGLRDFEVSFLRLIEAVTNGSLIEISYTGTTVIYKPGLIIGGTHTHTPPLSRAVGYYIEPLLLLAPFGKKAMTITFKECLTTSADDLGVDAIRTSIFPVMNKFGIDRQELRILKRGSAPLGGGEVVLSLPHLVLQPATIHQTSAPVINKIRGIAYSTRVSPATVNRIVESAREVLRATKCENFIYTDVARGDEAGKSPGFGVTLVAETKVGGWNYSTEAVGTSGSTPEDLGKLISARLLEEISFGGAVSRNQVLMAIVFMVLGKEDIGRLCLSNRYLGDPKFIRLLRTVKKFWGVEALIRDLNDDEFICSIKGTGFVSSSKKIA
ncbi:hypothetical protein DV451_001865 [Geotrichum candidum]|uniref:Similar to Saccharomyces cerevisiae YOL010W RCL1 Subunit of U3-containing 90S preribosome processome complex involved in 18S rRNA biogenesis and small ribosomal subunit assembly n=1 Tax=Geotrichum candidum TaxID=1173061 RepID=A0A0J9XJE3_GEOCN|nr:hypothetical protein DV451_001865 [Geotrichum candidum]KAI9210068.1 hypothetical protein DS838_005045 [Geotrichum bryndzae]KAF5105064.1 hypothetical protein DV453_005086 [Geotrichum candidum]KAF5109040.1 hypothetical protein DV452_004728 [Geotrichum candidum]KAF5114308.1 hypothetical protein DV454_003005 [Geotrichum candidum]